MHEAGRGQGGQGARRGLRGWRRGSPVLLGLLGLLGIVALALAAALLLAVERTPRVPLRDQVEPADVARAVQLAKQHDPRRQPAGSVALLQLGARDLDLLLNHAAHRVLGAHAEVKLETGAAQLDASVPLPAGRWLNLRSRWVEDGGRARLQSLRVGALPLPAWAGERLLHALVERSGVAGEIDMATGMVQRVSFRPGELSLTYRWDGQAPRRMLDSLVAPDDLHRLREQTARLAELTWQRPRGSNLPLSQALAPLADLARRRADGGNDALLELRAALMVLTAYANGRPLAAWLPAARGWPQPARLSVTLDGRADFALHFLISSLLAIDGTSPLSMAVGVYKELADAQPGGSGFSFNDIAADRAGTRLGVLAVERPRELLERLAGRAGASAPTDHELMPPWRDLPEFMPKAEFSSRFGGVGAPEYERMLAEIDRRIAALPLLR